MNNIFILIIPLAIVLVIAVLLAFADSEEDEEEEEVTQRPIRYICARCRTYKPSWHFGFGNTCIACDQELSKLQYDRRFINKDNHENEKN